MAEEHVWFGEARALLQQPPSPSSWTKLGALIRDAHNERWFATHALPYLENSLRRWPDQARSMPASWAEELTGKLRVALELQRSEGIPWTNVMRGRWDHFALAKSLVLPGHAWQDPFELMELLRRCTSLTSIEVVGGSLGMREVSSLRHVPSLRSIDLLDTTWSFDDLRGGATLFEIWPELSSFATRSVGTRRKATERFEATLRADQTLDTLRIHPENNVGTSTILSAISQNTPRHFDMGEFSVWTYPSTLVNASHEVLEGRGIGALPTLAGAGLLYPGLERLCVRSSERTSSEGASLEALVKSGASHSLRALEVCDGGVLLESLSPLHECTHLESLELGKRAFGARGGGLEPVRDPMQENILAMLEAMDEVAWTHLGFGGLLTLEIPEIHARFRARLEDMSTLGHLDVRDCCTETGVLARLFDGANLEGLRFLDWSRNGLDMGDIEALTATLCDRPAILDLSGCDMDDDKLERFLEGIGAHLKGISIHDNPSITARGYKNLWSYVHEHEVRVIGVDLTGAARKALKSRASPLDGLTQLSLGVGDSTSRLAGVLDLLPHLEQVLLAHEEGARSFLAPTEANSRWIERCAGESARRARLTRLE